MAPSGGYKGFGIGLMVEVMAAALSGAMLGIQASPFSGTDGGPPKTGQFFLGLDPNAYSGPVFNERITALTEVINNQGGARLPGARRMENRKRIDIEGVHVSDSLLEKIKSYCV